MENMENMGKQPEFTKINRVKYELDKNGVITVHEGKFKIVDLRHSKGIEVTHPDGTVEFIKGAKKIIAAEIGTVNM